MISDEYNRICRRFMCETIQYHASTSKIERRREVVSCIVIKAEI